MFGYSISYLNSFLSLLLSVPHNKCIFFRGIFANWNYKRFNISLHTPNHSIKTWWNLETNKAEEQILQNNRKKTWTKIKATVWQR